MAIDAICEECLESKDLKWASTTQTLGQIIGPLVTSNLYLYAVDKYKNFTGIMFLSLAIFVVISTIGAYIVIDENPSQ